jgi:hypothetical protein
MPEVVASVRRSILARDIASMEVELRVGVVGMPEGLVEVLMVKAVNRSRFPVTVRGAGIRVDEKRQFVITRPFLSNLPIDLAANSGSGTVMVRLSAVRELVPQFDLGTPQQAYMVLQSGERFESATMPLSAQQEGR